MEGELLEKDYQKGAWQLHIAFHKEVLDAKAETEQDFKKILEHAHSLFDTLVMWIEEMQKQIYKLEGALEAADIALIKERQKLFKRC